MNIDRSVEARVNQAYIKGYEQGFESGRREGLMQKYTPNQIREALGPPRVEKEETKDELAKAIESSDFVMFRKLIDANIASSTNPIHKSLYSCLSVLTTMVQELDKRTR